MKRSMALVLFLAPAVATAQAPEKLGYQGRLLRSDGSPEAGVVAMNFSLFETASGGTAAWSE